MLAEFDKVRLQVNSQIAAVRKPATLLVAIESTLEANSPPLGYLVALTSTLDQLKPKQDPTLHCAVLYLLSLLLPAIPPQHLQPHAAALLATVDPLFKTYAADAPPLKSLLSISSALLSALNLAQLTSAPVPKRVFTAVLLLTTDARPKVRRKAQEVVADVLASPPAPASKHPFRQESCAWITDRLEEAVRGAKRSGEGDEARAIALLVFVKNLGASWDATSTPQLLPLVLASLTLSSPHLTLTALTLLSHLFSATNEEQNTPEAIEETLEALLLAKPKGGMGTEGGEKLLAGWAEGVGEGVVALARISTEKAAKTTRTIFPTLLAILPPSTMPVLRQSIETALSLLVRHCITDAEILAAIDPSSMDEGEGQPGSTLASIIELLSTSLTSTRFAGPSLPHLLNVLRALFLRLRLRIPTSSTPTTAASTLLRPILVTLAALRSTNSFEWKRQLDDVLSTSIQVCGPEAFLDILPLDLLPSADKKKKSTEWSGGRAYLLPLLKPAITNTSLEHFKSHFIPLSSSLFLLSSSAKESERTLEAKIYDTLIDQIWALLPGYCTYPLDLPTAFSLDFLNSLTTILYSTPSLRQPILRALQLLLSTTTSLAASQSPPELLFAQFGLTPEDGRKNLAHLQGLAPTVLGVAFNVYTQLDKSEVGGGVGAGVLAVVKDWSAILGPGEREGVWSKIEALLRATFAEKAEKETKGEGVEIGLLDISLALIPEKGAAGKGKGTEGLKSMFELASSDVVLASKDQGVQKRGYRILNRLVEAGVLGGEGQAEKAGEVVEALVERGGKAASGAKRDRTALLATLVDFLPATALHHLPSLLPEAVLNTKESNERTREAAYDLLVQMGRKMDKGGVLDRTKVRGMDVDADAAEAAEEGEDAVVAEPGTEAVEASLDEFIKMVSAGLAATSPHMISATITSLSRLVFEFHSSLPQETLTELLSTLIIFLSSASREIVRSAIGYVKVALVSLPTSLVAPSLPTLVPALLNWSHEHSNHFKVKIRHLLERFIKKFGIDAIERECPEDDRKLITNIRKRVMRSKKKKTKQAEEDGEKEMDEDEAAPRPQVGGRSAYDEVIYGGSDSEASEAGSDDDNAPTSAPTAHNRKTQARKNKARDGEGTFIHEADGEVLDLLDDRMMSRISAARPTSGAARKSLASHFKTDDSGRMQIDDEPSSSSKGAQLEGGEGMGAYLEAMRGEDGHTRDAKGKTKFNKTQGKRARGDDEFGGEGSVVEGLKELEVGGGAAGARKKKVKRESVKIGAEFKAKNAGGDVDRNGMKPYAYVPLQSVAGKNKSARGPQIDITGHKTGRKQKK